MFWADLIFEKPTSIWWLNETNNGKQYFCYLQINNSQLPLASITKFNEENSKLFYRYSTV